MTLLAFGGGAPDVFASIAAANGGELEGIEMAIAVLVGSSLFIIAVINAVIIFNSPSAIEMNRVFFARDTSFLLISLLLLIYAVAIKGSIDLIMSIVFIALYVVYVLIVIYQDKLQENEANSEVAQKAALAANMVELNEITNFGAKPKNLAVSLGDGSFSGSSEATESLMSYDFESQFKQESSAFYYIDGAKQLDDRQVSTEAAGRAANEQTDDGEPRLNAVCSQGSAEVQEGRTSSISSTETTLSLASFLVNENHFEK